ncbi:uncharacterized protein TNCV_3422581 [Trichonephila clavipes]|nr:uncharacterized protein TNCV_3422581 [Trichonephila clavipes]
MLGKCLVRNKGCKTPLNLKHGICRHNITKSSPNANCLLRKTEWNEKKSSTPNFISIFVSCAGLVQASEERLKAWQLINLVMLFTIGDFSVVKITNFDITELKINLTLLLSLTLTSVIYFLMRRTRRRFSLLLIKLQNLPPCTEERIFNLLMPLIFLFPVAAAGTVTVLCDKKITSTKYAFGIEVENHWAQILVIFFKEYIYFFAFPAFPCLITVVYCTICVRCSHAIGNFTRKIFICSPEQFGPSEQIQVLRYKGKIDEILKITQEIFSVPSFCFIVANSVSCYSTLGSYIFSHLNGILIIDLASIISLGIASFLCLIGPLWIAGTLPVVLNKLKDTFYNKAYLRWISLKFPSEQNYRREILDKPDFAFTGFDIISYRRSSAFVIVGTLITYTVLIMSLP